MAVYVSSQDFAIAVAVQDGTLRLTERPSRFGDTYVAISDECGLIEVALTMSEAQGRIDEIARRVAR